jgi:hypothetical protein
VLGLIFLVGDKTVEIAEFLILAGTKSAVFNKLVRHPDVIGFEGQE